VRELWAGDKSKHLQLITSAATFELFITWTYSGGHYQEYDGYAPGFDRDQYHSLGRQPDISTGHIS
jgi:hypothetical protein